MAAEAQLESGVNGKREPEKEIVEQQQAKGRKAKKAKKSKGPEVDQEKPVCTRCGKRHHGACDYCFYCHQPHFNGKRSCREKKMENYGSWLDEKRYVWGGS